MCCVVCGCVGACCLKVGGAGWEDRSGRVLRSVWQHVDGGAWLAEDGGSGRATSLMWCSWDGAGNNNLQVVR